MASRGSIGYGSFIRIYSEVNACRDTGTRFPEIGRADISSGIRNHQKKMVSLLLFAQQQYSRSTARRSDLASWGTNEITPC